MLQIRELDYMKANENIDKAKIVVFTMFIIHSHSKGLRGEESVKTNYLLKCLF